MNRVIKFRGWNKKTNKMIDLQKITPFATELPGLFLPCEPYLILMQFTGFQDKNGKEIYEGDIVKYASETSDQPPFVIEYMELKNCGDCFKDSGIGFNLYLRDPDELIVIGNKFENPELLVEDDKNVK